MRVKLKSGLKFLPLLALLFWLLRNFLKKNAATVSPGKIKVRTDYKSYILAELAKNGVPAELAKYIFCQAAFETGNFSSVIFQEQNNLFGMKLARVRPTKAVGEARGHAVFKSIADSVADYVIYYNYVKLPALWSSIRAFTTALKGKKYFEADLDQYTNGVEAYYKAYFG